MHAWLLFEDRDTDKADGYSFPADLIQDFQLDIVIRTMAGQSQDMQKLIRGELMHPLTSADDICYRQEIIQDLVRHEENFLQLYNFIEEIGKIAADYRSIERLRRGSSRRISASVYIDKINCIAALTDGYEKLHGLLAQGEYSSRGMTMLYRRLDEELPLERLKAIKEGLDEISFWLKGGSVTLSGRFCQGMKLGDFVVNEVANLSSDKDRPPKKLTFMEQISKAVLKTNINILQEEILIDQAKQLEEAVAGWLLLAFDDYLEGALDFFMRLHYEASFYKGCCNLVCRFQDLKLPMCVPEVLEEKREFSFEGLYDLNLAIYFKRRPMVNALCADDIDLYIITGANQGGKSTWLRSVGSAQVLMQCGMLVPAYFYKSRLYSDIFTHFGRQEDRNMNSGRFDEELRRMDLIMEHMTTSSLLFMNESFASTTETEGAVVLKNITDALYEMGITVFTVTHLFEYTQEMYGRKQEQADMRTMFLSAERTQEAVRTYRINPMEPSPTSYGLDLYEELIEQPLSDQENTRNAKVQQEYSDGREDNENCCHPHAV